MEISQNKKLLILDMNSTFMFGEDRFEKNKDYSKYYKSIGGTKDSSFINKAISLAYEYLEVRYTDEKYKECFPSLKEAIKNTIDIRDNEEIKKIIDTFSYYERGHIPKEYILCIEKLSKHFTLAAIIDIWAPSKSWIELFKELNIYSLFSNISFSSDINIVKPSPIAFKDTLEKLNINPNEALMIGDSIRRDLGGANGAGIDCIIVGEQKTSKALACFDNLLEFEKSISYN